MAMEFVQVMVGATLDAVADHETGERLTHRKFRGIGGTVRECHHAPAAGILFTTTVDKISPQHSGPTHRARASDAQVS